MPDTGHDHFLHAIDKFPSDFYGADNDLDSRAAVVKLRAACDDYLNDDEYVDNDGTVHHRIYLHDDGTFRADDDGDADDDGSA